MSELLLGIEIGGTKLQLGIGRGDGRLLEMRRYPVVSAAGEAGIIQSIRHSATELLAKYQVARMGIGFGGPVDISNGRVIKSHQIDGWDDFPLASWCDEQFKLPAAIDNDCNVAALAEATYGAGQGHQTVFYVTVGTGVGGGLVVDSRRWGIHRPAIAEIGQMRPGPECHDASQTVESLASGWGIVDQVRSDIQRGDNQCPGFVELLDRCEGNVDLITGRMVAQAAIAGNPMAANAIHQAAKTLGWAIAQVVTLVAPEVVVVGGGVASMQPSLFLEPIRAHADRYVFPPLRDRFLIVPAALGDQVVVHGAIAIASQLNS